MGKPGSGVKEKGKVAPGSLGMTQKHLCFYQLKGPSIPSERAGSVFGLLNLTRASGGTPHPQIFTFKTHSLSVSYDISHPFPLSGTLLKEKHLRKEIADASFGLLPGHTEQWAVLLQNGGVTRSFLIVMGTGSAGRHSWLLRGTWKIVTMLTSYFQQHPRD